jgi:phenylacetate-CoA ligase
MHQLALHLSSRSDLGKAFRIFESSGELLAEHQRATISRVFQCDIVNRYGLAEVGIVAYQTGQLNPRMLVLDPAAWPEIALVDETNEFFSFHKGRLGELVLTATKNRMMPLIRYRTGDLAVLSETPCGFAIDLLLITSKTCSTGSAGSRNFRSKYAIPIRCCALYPRTA